MSTNARIEGESTGLEEGPRLVSGCGLFIADLRPPEVLHVHLVRSLEAHARIRSIETPAASASPGVVGVFTHTELAFVCDPLEWIGPLPPNTRCPPRPALAQWEARFAGEPLAAVVAESVAEARNAADGLEVTLEPLPGILEPESALLQRVPCVHVSLGGNVAYQFVVSGGDTEEGFRKADRVLTHRIARPRYHPAPLETRGVVARWLESEKRLEVWSSTESPHFLRAQLAGAMRLPQSAVRVFTPDVGGAFGSKLGATPEELVVCAIARIVAPRPVQWIETREESLAFSTQARATSGELKVGVREDGRLLSISYDGIDDVGAYLPIVPGHNPSAEGTLLCGAYQIPAARMAVTAVFTNNPPATSCHGAGACGAGYIIERAMDLVAAALELDCVEVRRLNLFRELPATTVTRARYDSGDFSRLVDRAVERSQYAVLRHETSSRRRKGELVGLGVALLVGIGAQGPSRETGGPAWEAATVHVSADGSAEVFTGGLACGEGHETVLARIAAHALGVKADAVRVGRADTQTMRAGVGSFGGRSIATTGSAVLGAARALERRLRGVAAGILCTSVEYVDRDGADFVSGSRRVSYRDLCLLAHGASQLEPGSSPLLEETFVFEPQGSTHPISIHVAQVVIDSETGEVSVERCCNVRDLGRELDPALVEAQVRGGIALGIELALLAGSPRGDDGQPLQRTFMERPVSRAQGVPRFDISSLPTPTTLNPLGAKGLGDTVTMAAFASVMNAVVDALRPLGVLHVDPPATPEKIWRIVRSCRGTGGA